MGDQPAKIGVPTLRSSRSPDILSVLFSLFTQRFQVLKSFCQEVLSNRVKGIPHRLFSYCVYYTRCENTARIRVQYIVPLPDILHTLRKQFLVGYYYGDTFTGFH